MVYEVGFDELYQQVLTWDLYDLIEGVQLYKLDKIAVSYPSVDAYLDAFEPILLEEARAQLERARQDETIQTHKLQLLSVEKRGCFYHAHFERPAADVGAVAPKQEVEAVVAPPSAPEAGAPAPMVPPPALGPTIAPSTAADLQLEGERRLYYDSDLIFISAEPLDASLVEQLASQRKAKLAAQAHVHGEGADDAEAADADADELKPIDPALAPVDGGPVRELTFAEQAAADAAGVDAAAPGAGGGRAAAEPGRIAAKRQRFHCLGLVHRSGGTGAMQVLLYLPSDQPAAMPACTFKRLSEMQQLLVPPKGVRWHVRRIGNMVTVQREWMALQALSESPLASQLLALTPGGGAHGARSAGAAARAARATGSRMAMPPALYKFITHPRHFNKSQKEALLAALKQRGVTLVQGPPGTGKTATILGLLSVLLHARPRGTAATPEALGLRAADMLAEASAEEARAGRPETAAEPTARAAARIALARAAMPWLRPPPPPSAHDVAAAARAAAAAVLLVEAGAQPLGALEQKPYYPSVTDTDEHVPLGSLEPRADGKGGGAARVGGGKGASGPARVLVCTPSNAAVDEIVRRLLTFGIRDADGEPYFPDVVRVGPNFAEDVRARSLDVLARKKAAELEQDSSAAGGARGPGAGSNFRLLDRARLAVLNSSSIVCTTLSCAGYAMFAQLQRGFDTVLIDEAAQAVEVASLIPLRAGCERLIMVGDPAQLPATIFSAHAANAGYERSLFERLQQAGHRTHLLRTQYRMHPEISRWPAKHFYNGRLVDAAEVVGNRARTFHSLRLFAPYSFVDVADGVAARNASASFENEMEARLAVHIVAYLVQHHADVAGEGCESIGVVSPYNGQVKLIRGLLRAQLGADVVSRLDVHSVDGFQGREKEVVIFSCVRAGPGGIGFLKDARRLNVALTRAKSLLLVLGSAQTLDCDSTWRAMLADARARGCVIKATAPIERWFSHASQQPAPRKPAGEADAPPAQPADEPTAGAPDRGHSSRAAPLLEAPGPTDAASKRGAHGGAELDEPVEPSAKRTARGGRAN